MNYRQQQLQRKLQDLLDIEEVEVDVDIDICPVQLQRLIDKLKKQVKQLEK